VGKCCLKISGCTIVGNWILPIIQWHKNPIILALQDELAALINNLFENAEIGDGGAAAEEPRGEDNNNNANAMLLAGNDPALREEGGKWLTNPDSSRQFFVQAQTMGQERPGSTASRCSSPRATPVIEHCFESRIGCE
jgi:hypothetical protein